MNTLIRAVRPWGQALSDVLITDGKIDGVEPHDPGRAAAAQIDVDCRLELFDAVMAAKEQFRDRADVDIIAFPQAGLLLEEGTVPLMDEALKAGANVIGGIDPCSLDRDPARHLDIVFGLAEKYQVPIDIHLHEPGELGVFSTDLVIERTRALGMQGKVTMSHAYQLGSVTEATTRRLIEEFAELDISMASVAPSVSGQLPIPLLAEAGVRMGLGEDGQRDYWSPYGNTDMLDRTWQLAFTHGFRKDEHIEHCLAIASVGGASILDPSATRLKGTAHRPGLEVGDPAELLLLDGEAVASAVMDRGADRTVSHRGTVVADQLELQTNGCRQDSQQSRRDEQSQPRSHDLQNRGTPRTSIR